MMDLTQLRYYDRRTGELKQDPIYAYGLVDWLYNSTVGRFLTEFLLSRRWVSCFYGWLNRQRWSRSKIIPFAERLAVDLDELCRPVEDFESFNDFITREIDLPIDRFGQIRKYAWLQRTAARSSTPCSTPTAFSPSSGQSSICARSCAMKTWLERIQADRYS